MQINLNSSDKLKHNMNVLINYDEIEKKINQKINTLSKTMTINGFRKGKIPFKVIENRFNESIKYEVINETIKDSVISIMEENSFTPVYTPKIDIITYPDNKNNLQFNVEFEIYPIIKINPLKSIHIEKEVINITNDDLNKITDNLCKQHTLWIKANKPLASMGDKLIVKIQYFNENMLIKSISNDNLTLILGNKNIFFDIEMKLFGSTIGENITISFKMPENYNIENLANKIIICKIEILDILKPQVPKLNNEFIKKFGYDSIELFMAELKENITKETDSTIHNNMKQRLIEELMNQNSFAIPEYLQQTELQRLKNFHKTNDNDANLITQSEYNIKKNLILHQLIQDFNINVNEHINEEYVKKITNDQVNYMKQLLLEQNLFDKLFAAISIKEKNLKLFDIMEIKEDGNYAKKYL